MSMNPMSQQQQQQQQQHHHGTWPREPAMHLYHHPCQLEQREGHHEREQMFEKCLTPSDVGKLNRLVIPKQHAEKYFPLDGNSGEKDLALSFEDETGKPWRFRYSYWSSSQSYVLTKGWSRFVKEKKLDAGDVVLFQRPRGGGDRLYIGCRRQGANETPSPARTATRLNEKAPWSRVHRTASGPHPVSPSGACSRQAPVQQDGLRHAGETRQAAAENTAVAPGGKAKRLRLFGVNLECGPASDRRPLHSASWL
ncbi:unnamed protein product [Musa acuminata subsp. malaccensis]|uniref:(wild Malaysian banana) hypothetical protein n=1 Tax=Musa acuminata subsp. malaccensis TaxID=214687 RepID=A0A804JGA4_MUSAM|nr:unnamed protein product [Musa acuminata subsp. malaccensis]